MNVKRIIRSIFPAWAIRLYHHIFAAFAAVYYRRPGNKLIIIGITGTNGKSTTVQMVGHILRSTGHRVAWMSTATERIGDIEKLNTRKMTMPGHGTLQKFLRDAVDAHCTYAVTEVSSEGLAQSRHVSIPFDVAVFLNITPEHIESHGSFERYRDAKLKLFRYMASERVKKNGRVQERSVVLNMDDKEGQNFFCTKAEHYYATSRSGTAYQGFEKVFWPTAITPRPDGGNTFTIDGNECQLPVLGLFNVDNALSAIAATYAVGIPIAESTHALQDFPGVPGRLEFIMRDPFTVIVDYAPEPASMQALYDLSDTIQHNRIIHVFGSAGGGRDVVRRPILGKIVGARADIAIVTNEDPYDDDPMQIINQVAQGVVSVGRLHEQEDLFRVLDRREAIRLAVGKAESGDLIFITGKACEQWIMGPLGTKTPWDDRKVAREELQKKGYLST